ncbi:ATP synthase F1 subunit gamma [Mycoplasma sp. 1232]|uniref:ATP synthase F1 subunit gamma n=1 Tax=Mycoplasma sp. 1232 TaxID=3108527 RepID=UPI002B262E11|nr:ATP synthase F1 subunit gamma [Mycoplasma sp. 1232]MEA4333424.1 ATP synthase F1 subunit gamma [Mycoplasma sp. 1232]
MANLNSIKNRINVINNTKKITNAMQLVSTAKLRRIRNEFESIETYLNSLNEMFRELASHVEPREFYSIFPKNTNVDSDLHIIITSDLGLCGSYNTNIVKLLKETLKPSDKIIVLGGKGLALLHSFKYDEQVISKYTELGDKISYELSSVVSKKAFEEYSNKRVANIYIYYTEFINNITQEAKKLKLFPLDIESENASVQAKNTIEFEPNSEVVLKNSIPLYLASMVYGLATGSKVSEIASRRNAMENATNNATDLVDELRLQFNRKRQSNITQEINEIVAGADAT